ncbi:hypothetical protein FXO37_16104 [Capsicum annuum]|nr:hypothetical protein FXO37_16104 [Capsicum annuum]
MFELKLLYLAEDQLRVSILSGLVNILTLSQIVLLLNETANTSESSGNGYMMILQAEIGQDNAKEITDLQRFASVVSPPSGRKWIADVLAVVAESKEVAGDMITETVLDQKVTSLNAAVERAQIPTVMKTDLKVKFSVLQNQVTKAKKKIAAENIQKAVKAASETSGALASGGKSYCILQIDVGLDTGAVREAVVKVMEQKDANLKEISDYAESSEDVLPERSVSGDSEESKGSGRNSDDGDNDPLSVPHLSRFIFVERYDLRMIMDEVGSYPAKISKKSDLKKQREEFDEKQKASYALFGFSWAFMNVHSYIIPILHETKMDYMIFFDSYADEVKNNVLNGLKKELEGVTILISNEDSDDDGNLGGNPVEVRVGDDDTPSTSKDAAGTSSFGDLHKHVAVLEEAVLDIAAYIREKRLKKKK